MKARAQNTVSASELVKAAKAGFLATQNGAAELFAQTFAATLNALGVVGVNANVGAIPPQASAASASVRGSKGHARVTVAGLPTLPRRTEQPFDETARGLTLAGIKASVLRDAERPASVTPDVPSVTVSDKYRTILPKTLFDAGEGQTYTHILVTFPDGAEQQINTNDEGRGRCPSAWFGADAGHVAYFHETEAGVYTVHISGKTVSTAEDMRRTRQGSPVGHVGRAESALVDEIDAALELAFAAPTRDKANAGGSRKGRASKPPTAAQTAARERFATETRVIKCAECLERVKIGETVDGICAKHYTADPLPKRPTTRGASPVVAHGTRSDVRAARVTPNFATPAEGVTDNTGRAARMKANAERMRREKEQSHASARAEGREVAARLSGLPTLPRRA
jgi:hypothetical protein